MKETATWENYHTSFVLTPGMQGWRERGVGRERDREREREGMREREGKKN